MANRCSPSTNDDGALRNKVNEAMSVYDDYVRTNKDGNPKDAPDGMGSENQKPRPEAEAQS